MKGGLEPLVTRMKNLLERSGLCTLLSFKKFEDIKEGFAKSEAKATSFY